MYVDIRGVVRKHDKELRRFRRGLFSLDAADSGLASVLPAGVLEQLQATGRTVPRRFGPVRSVTTQDAVLTVVGDITDQSVFLDEPGRAGSVLMLSIAAQHKRFGTRPAVDPGEARAWVGEIVGPSWLPHVYSAGALTGAAEGGSSVSRPLTTLYFYLFLGADGVPHAEPGHRLGVELFPLGDMP
ncbi:hypothetical protein ACFYVL_17345 [Streptomyces sp. NPDC004111]|uniref:hypothetical protein n=1 Tax=Streptomyces sp. NPDC004111 TaxID=3364690 RepID=UPI0036B33778